MNGALGGVGRRLQCGVIYGLELNPPAGQASDWWRRAPARAHAPLTVPFSAPVTCCQPRLDGD